MRVKKLQSDKCVYGMISCRSCWEKFKLHRISASKDAWGVQLVCSKNETAVTPAKEESGFIMYQEH